MINTIRGSQLEDFYPKGWDLRRIDACCALGPRGVTKPAKHWDRNFKAIAVREIGKPMGDAIADVIERTRQRGRRLAIILPVGPVADLGDVLDGELVHAREMVVSADTDEGPLRMVGNPIHIVGAPRELDAPPRLHEHTAEVFGGLGADDQAS